MDITYSLSFARDLIAPQFLYPPADIAANPKLVPNAPGIYGWWFDDALVGVPNGESLQFDGRRLLYVGIAPSAPARSGVSSKRTLRDRLKNHTRGPIATSTLRRTLTSLVGRELGLSVTRSMNGKLTLSRENEQSLTEWMTFHARVAWMVHTSPWEIESALIKSGPRLPLNIKESSDPYRHELKALRKGLTA